MHDGGDRRRLQPQIVPGVVLQILQAAALLEPFADLVERPQPHRPERERVLEAAVLVGRERVGGRAPVGLV